VAIARVLARSMQVEAQFVVLPFGELLDALVRGRETERIDLVLLEEIPAPLAFRIVRDGERLLVTDPRADVSFRTRAIMRYLDFKPLRDAAFRSGRKAILAPD
jgi:hypothetical protein